MIDFFVLGAVKAGTTSLHNYLNQHPLIEMSRQKWTRFFHVDGQGPDFNEIARRHGTALLQESLLRFKMICNSRVPKNFESYIQQWDASRQGVIRGEISPTYMYDYQACQRIRARFPNAKIILILRDPLQRAISHYAMDHANHWTPDNDFQTALRKEPWQIDEFWWGLRHFLRHGLYSRSLAQVQSIFTPKQTKIMLYDDMLASPSAFLDEITDFLKVDRMKFDAGEWYNVAPESKPILDYQTGRSLSRFFEQDILLVQTMIDRDLGNWLNKHVKVN